MSFQSQSFKTILLTFALLVSIPVYSVCRTSEGMELESLSTPALFQEARCQENEKQYKSVENIFHYILKNRPEGKKGAAQGLVRLIRNGNTELDFVKTATLLASDRDLAFEAMQVEPLLIQTGKWKAFRILFEQYPTNLNDEQWDLFLAILEPEEFDNLISRMEGGYRKTILQIRYLKLHGKYREALNLIQNQENISSHLLIEKADICYLKKDNDCIDETMDTLKSQGSSGYRSAARFLFEHGDARQALATASEGVERDYPLHYEKVFFLMTTGKAEEAAHFLILYRQQNKIDPYRHQQLKQDFFDQYDWHIYAENLDTFLLTTPRLCREKVDLYLEKESAAKLVEAIQECEAKDSFYRVEDTFLRAMRNNRKEKAIAILDSRPSLSSEERYTKAVLLSQTGKREKAHQIFLILWKESPDFSAEKKREIALNAAALNKWGFVEEVERNSTAPEDKTLYLYSLLQLNDDSRYLTTWKNLPDNQRESIENLFFDAVASLLAGELSESEELLKEYLEKPGRFSETAFSTLYVLSTFPDKPEKKILAKQIIEFPGTTPLFSRKDLGNINNENLYDQMLFWTAAREAELGMDTAEKDLRELSESKHIDYLQPRILYYLEQLEQKKDAKQYPWSPYRVLTEK